MAAGRARGGSLPPRTEGAKLRRPAPAVPEKLPSLGPTSRGYAAQRETGAGSLAEEGPAHRGRPPLAPDAKGRAPAGTDKAMVGGKPPHITRPPRAGQPTKEKPPSKAAAGQKLAEPREAVQPAPRGHEKEGNVLRDYVSEDLRKVLDEEEVTYSWRRRPAPEAESAQVEKPPVPEPDLAPEPRRHMRTAREAGSAEAQPDSAPAPGANSSNHPSAGYGKGVLALAKLETAKASAPSPPSAPMKIDLETAASRFPEPLQREWVCSQVQLVTYDGSAPSIRPGPLCVSTGDEPTAPTWLLRWLKGKCSAAVASLYAQSWLQSELKWEKEAAKTAAPSPLAAVAGLVGDPTQISEALHLPPQAAAAEAVSSILRAAKKEAGEMLVSEVEVALTKLETESLGSPEAYFSAALAREILRYACCQQPEEEQTRMQLGDAWLRDQLEQTPEEIIRRCKASSEEVLRKENRFLDRHLMQLLGAKRRLAALLDDWEKIDHYAILGVPRTVSDKELRNAYRKACLRLHPDKGGDKQQFQQLQDSYARILEEREKEKSSDPNSLDAAGKSPRHAGDGMPSASGPLEALEALSAAPDAVHPAAKEVLASVGHLQQLAEELQGLLSAAERADRLVRGLRKTPPADGVEALASAQEAGETLLSVSQKISEAAPALSESAMEVAECSLSVAARFAAVPCALLLTDVALSCTLEAARLKHAGQLLHEVRRDTIGTLQTLQAAATTYTWIAGGCRTSLFY
eukprot:s3567_g1.t1